MSITQPPHPTPSPAPHPLWRRWWQEEWRHWEATSSQTRCLLIGLSLLLFFVDPLLPPTAYILQRWAASAWTWRDRWTSVWIWAKQGVWFVTLIVIVVLLAVTHIWIIPQLIAAAQTVWQQILPGTLSLSIFDSSDLLARSLLLLPLAPALAFLYERIDTRTYVRLKRVLTPADLEPKPITPDPSPPTPDPAPAPDEAAPKKTRTYKQKSRKTKAPPAEQVTIDSFLDQPLPAEEIAQTHQPKKKKRSPSPHRPATMPIPAKTTSERTPIDWDSVTE